MVDMPENQTKPDPTKPNQYNNFDLYHVYNAKH